MRYDELIKNEQVKYILQNTFGMRDFIFNHFIAALEFLEELNEGKLNLDEFYTFETVFGNIHYHKTMNNSYYFSKKNSEAYKLLDKIDYVLNCKFNNENLTFFHNYYNIDKKEIIEFKNLILNDFYDPIKEKKKKEEKESEYKLFLDRYYKNKLVITEKEMNKYITMDKIIYDINDSEIEVLYPLIVFKYRDNELISISRVQKNLYSNIGYSIRADNIDHFSFIHVPEKFLNEIYLECLIKYQPLKISTNSFSIENSLYVTYNKLKKRYKDIYKKTIMKIIDKYDVPIYNIQNNFMVIHRDKFDEAYNSELHNI